MNTTTTTNKLGRLRVLLIAAAAIGSSSATLSGALVAFAIQHPPAAASDVALV